MKKLQIAIIYKYKGKLKDLIFKIAKLSLNEFSLNIVNEEKDNLRNDIEQKIKSFVSADYIKLEHIDILCLNSNSLLHTQRSRRSDILYIDKELDNSKEIKTACKPFLMFSSVPCDDVAIFEY